MNESKPWFHTRPMAGAALGAVLAAILGSLAPDWVLLAVCTALIPVSAFLFRRRSAFFLLPILAFTVLVRIVLLPTAMPTDWPVAGFLQNLRQNLRENANVLFGDLSAEARGIFLGDTSVLGKAERAQYANVGLMHLFAVSGLHVTLLTGMIGKAVRTGNKPLSIGLLSLFLLFLCAVTGFSPSVLRAAFVLIGLRLTHLRERQVDMPSVFCFAMAMTLLCDPAGIRSVSFQLSFAAMAGMILLAKSFRRPFPKKLRASKILTALSGASAATIGMLPVMAYYFGSVAWISIPLSILLIPTMPVLLLFGFLSVLLNGLMPHVSTVLSYPAYGGIKLISLVAQGVDVPALRLPAPHPAAIALYYAALLFCSPLFLPNHKRPPWIGLGLSAVSMILWFVL
ncbi:MAG: ComEC/Rec2 family competence protein [Clostridia bacterium]|nr:ComEC/Rec2 family competence protein [Clostridia bacterium]